ncbi:hypothetical protein GCM10027046_03090 [Uliginosibacterium flavum]|uniref:Radical SAM protein n=1 Tax=Uliginosibacterium flavum TaxID=1396831 RepID=A0ABV2THY0_9RHOO
MNPAHRPASLLLQWHLSDACNLRCTHCYQDEFEPEERGLADWQQVLDDYLHLLRTPSAIRGHINVTGGEPFALRDFPALLDRFAQQRADFSFGILTNGTLIDRSMARRLRHWQPGFVQVSIDGVAATHDAIRGAGSHARAVAGIQALLAEDIKVLISFTAQPDNFREFGEVARLGHALGVAKVWSDRVIPAGPDLAAQMLSPAQTSEYLHVMAEARAALPANSKTEIALHRALQFLEGGDAVYRCTAGDSLITVMPDGTLYPCRRLPIPMGNAYERPLIELYADSPMQAIRQPLAQEGCTSCGFAGQCQGGLRCLSWAVHGRLDQADPGCELAGPTRTPRVRIPIHSA